MHVVQASQKGLQQQLAEAIAAESFDEADGLQAELDAAVAEIISLGGTPARPSSPEQSSPQVIMKFIVIIIVIVMMIHMMMIMLVMTMLIIMIITTTISVREVSIIIEGFLRLL